MHSQTQLCTPASPDGTSVSWKPKQYWPVFALVLLVLLGVVIHPLHGTPVPMTTSIDPSEPVDFNMGGGGLFELKQRMHAAQVAHSAESSEQAGKWFSAADTQRIVYTNQPASGMHNADSDAEPDTINAESSDRGQSDSVRDDLDEERDDDNEKVGDKNVPIDDVPTEDEKSSSPPLPGHLQPIGAEGQMHYVGEVNTLHHEVDWPSAAEFWHEWIYENWKAKPKGPTSTKGGALLLKGAARKHPAFKLWNDEEYLLKQYGNITVKAELKKEVRCTGDEESCKDSNLINGKKPHVPLKQIVLEGNKTGLYAITELPRAMSHEVLMPAFLLCGKRPKFDRPKDRPWLTQLYEVDFWVVKNKNQSDYAASALHYDMNHALMCLYSGRKEWLLMDPRTEISNMYFVDGSYRPDSPLETVGSDFSRINQERIDLHKYPKLKKVSYRKAVMEAGDCMFIPALYVHQVNTFGSSIAMSALIHKLEVLDPGTCSSKDAPAPTNGQPLSLKDFDPLWTFPGYREDEPGHGKVHLGYMPWKQSRERLRLIATLPENLKGKISRKQIKTWCHDDGAANEGTQSMSVAAMSKFCDEGMAMLFDGIGDILIAEARSRIKDSMSTKDKKLDARLVHDSTTKAGFRFRPTYVLVSELYTPPLEKALRYWATKYDEAR